MKRFLALILAIVICLGLAACGTKGDKTNNENDASNAGVNEEMDDALNRYYDLRKPSTAEVPSEYQTLDAKQFSNDTYDDEHRMQALPAYVGNAYEVTLNVEEVHDNYVVSGTVWGADKHGTPQGYACSAFWVIYLSEEDIKEVNKGDKITVIGVVDEIDLDTVDENGKRIGLYRVEYNAAYNIYDNRQAIVVTPAKLVK